MPFHRIADPDFWTDITSPALRFNQELARANGLELGAILMADDDNEEPPMTQLLQLPPGGVLPRHAHFCYRVEVMVKGSMDVGDGRILGPGDVMISMPGEYYGPHVAGPEGSLSVEVFSNASAPTVFEDPETAPDTSLIERSMDEFKANARKASASPP